MCRKIARRVDVLPWCKTVPSDSITVIGVASSCMCSLIVLSHKLREADKRDIINQRKRSREMRAAVCAGAMEWLI
jgi:hypothetical protein